MQRVRQFIQAQTGLTRLSEQLLEWPPDVFAVVGTILKKTGSYSCVVKRLSSNAQPIATAISGLSQFKTMPPQNWSARKKPPEVRFVKAGV